MKKLICALVGAALSLGLMVASAHAQGCGTQNPNCIVPTAPPGTNNNQAASTAFVQQNTSGLVAPPVISGDPACYNGLAAQLKDCVSATTVLTLSPTPNSTLQGLLVNQTLPSGTASAGTSFGANIFNVTDNGYQSPEGFTGDPVFGLLGSTAGFRVNYTSKGNGIPNFPIYIGGLFATAATGAGQQLVGLNGTVYSNINSTANDSFWAGISYAHLGPSANVRGIYGHDAEVSIATGGTALYRVGLASNSIGPVTGTTIDAGLAITACTCGVDGVASPWVNGIVLWKPDTMAPVSGSLIISSDAFTMQYGLKLDNITFANKIFDFGANVLQTDGPTGNTVIGGGSSGTGSLTLGVAGSNVGRLNFKNATSGTVTLSPVTGALGTVTINVPAAAGTMAVSAVGPITLSAAGAIGCASCITSAQTITLTGDVTGSSASPIATTLATVNSNVGTFGSATQAAQVTVNAKGLVTAASNVTVTPAVGSITGLGTAVATALAVNVGTAGSVVVNGGALGSPSSVGTLPAHTLGGAISGGGNQINNVVIGASTPLAGTFTTLTANTSVSSPIHTASGALTFQSNGSTFAGQITAGQQWVFGQNITPATGTLATFTNNATAHPTFTGNTPVVDIVAASNAKPSIAIYNFDQAGAGAGVQPSVYYLASRGTAAAQAAVQSGDFLGANFAYGYNSNIAGYATAAGAGFIVEAAEAYTGATAGGARFCAYGTPTATIAVARSGCFGAGLMVGTTTDPGAGNILANKMVQTGAVAVASLPTCNAGTKGARYFVTDANSTTYHATAAGGGANNMGVTCDGTNWYLS